MLFNREYINTVGRGSVEVDELHSTGILLVWREMISAIVIQTVTNYL